jgi:hypothetical protein
MNLLIPTAFAIVTSISHQPLAAGCPTDKSAETFECTKARFTAQFNGDKAFAPCTAKIEGEDWTALGKCYDAADLRRAGAVAQKKADDWATSGVSARAATRAHLDQFKNDMMDAIRNAMKDPESTRFRDVKIVEDHPIASNQSIVDVSFCAQFNSKNSFGGYTGYRHIYFYRNAAGVWTPLADNAAAIAKCENSPAVMRY